MGLWSLSLMILLITITTMNLALKSSKKGISIRHRAWFNYYRVHCIMIVVITLVPTVYLI
jgi:hypothetical protein